MFFVLWPLAWLVRRVGRAEGQAFQPDDGGPAKTDLRTRQAGKPDLRFRQAGKPDLRRASEAWQLFAILILALYLINLGYAFKASFQRLGDYRFQSRALSGQPPSDPPKPGNRFTQTWLGPLPVPLPLDYLQGIDCQRNDFEVGGRSYLHGRWAPRGWWYYYLIGLGIKTPLGTLALLVLIASIRVAELVRVRGALGNRSVGNALRGVPWRRD